MAYGERVKKLCWHTTFGDISVMEPQYREGKKRIRPFVCSAQISNRSCSRPLQRAITDFGADQPFGQVVDKLVEHYGILISESTIARTTQHHAKAIYEATPAPQSWPTKNGTDTVIIVETDGGMVPIVEIDQAQADRRKGKTLQWREAKICLAHPKGSTTLTFGGTLQGSVDKAGQCFFDCAVSAGFGLGTPIHGVGDGAPWIADQIEKRFGTQGSYLIDFYHACDYLSAAAKAILGEAPEGKIWMATQKNRLKANEANSVLQELQMHLEPATRPDIEAPVRQCHRYLSNRPNQLNYQDAIAKDLPIGSGEVESAHRYVVQQRMKRAGAWWLAQNAEHMLALRLNRANRKWDCYWQQSPISKHQDISTSL